MTGKCAKLETIAIIENNGQYWIGTNWCGNAQSECPRKDLPTGVGYEMCKDICKQISHAEVDACVNAGVEAKGGTLYLLGHTYCCDNCKNIMEEYGIVDVIIGRLPDSFMSKVVSI
jgi:deoxycytidylate deaminase